MSIDLKIFYKNRMKELINLKDIISGWSDNEILSIKEKQMAQRMIKTINLRLEKMGNEYYKYILRGDNDDNGNQG